MHFNTFVFTCVTFALAQATPAAMGRFANGTATEIPTFTDNSTNLETMPVMDSTSVFLPTTATTQTPQVITTVETMTLIYTLGPEGSNSVVTTVVETTSTITMTATMYITVTESDEVQPTETIPDGGIYPSLDSTALDSGSDTSQYPTTTSSDDFAFPTEDPALTSGEEPFPTADPTSDFAADTTTVITDDSATTTFEPTSIDFSATAQPTVTVTDYITTTETITLPPTEVSADFSSPTDGSFFQTTDGSGLDIGSSLISSLLGTGDGGCGSTVTTTVVELSTIIESPVPTSTDNLPIDPTIVPSYGCGNSTDPTTGYPTASSGFWTLYRRARPTQMLEYE